MISETLSKLYLELANVVPKDTISVREITYINAIESALRHLDGATPKQRNGPTYQAANALRQVLGLAPMDIEGKPSDGLPVLVLGRR